MVIARRGEPAAPFVLDGLAMRQEDPPPCQVELFPELQPLPLHERAVLRALVNAVNADDAIIDPPIEASTILAAVDTKRHPDPWSSVFHAPERMRKLRDLFHELQATGGVCEANHSRVARWLGRFLHQAEIAARLSRRDGFRPWGVTEEQVRATNPPASALSLAARDPRIGPLRAALFGALLSPITLLSYGGRSETQALGFVRYVLDGRERCAYIELRSADGSWKRSGGAWTLDRHFFTWDWLDLFLANHPELLRDPLGNAAGPATQRALKERLRHEVIASGLVRHVRQGIAALVPLDADIKHLTLALVPRLGDSVATSDDYTAVWQSRAAWSRLRAENDGLAVLLRCMQRRFPEAFPTSVEGCQAVRKFFRHVGVDGDSWRVLARHGREIVERAVQSTVERWVPDAIAIQARLLRHFTNELPAPALMDSLLRAGPQLLGNEWDIEIPHRLVKVASAACIEARKCGRQAAFILEEWLPVVAWLLEARPTIHRNQCEQGWACLMRAKSAWALRMLAENSNPEWQAFAEPLGFGEWEAIELHCAARLAVEGVEMAHCAGDFAEDCRQGKLRMFSLRRAADGKRVATISCVPLGAGWIVHQALGRANSEVDEGMWAIAAEIAAACSPGSGNPSRFRASIQ